MGINFLDSMQKETPLFIQANLCIVIAVGKYMYHSQKSYIDRVRMRQEWNKLLFLLYCCIVMCVVGEINVVLSTIIKYLLCTRYCVVQYTVVFSTHLLPKSNCGILI